MRNRILLLWLTAIPLLVITVWVVSCSRYSTGPDWQWSPPRQAIYPRLDEDPYEVRERPPEPTFVQEPDYGESEQPWVEPEPTEDTHWKVYRVRAKMNACSPQDPKDSGYYRRHGWKGAAYNMCFALWVIPEGSLVRITPEENEYMDKSFPGKWWTVDASGGPVIRRSARRGQVHGDVKYRTLYSVREFGNQHVTIEVILQPGVKPSRILLDNLVEVVWIPRE